MRLKFVTFIIISILFVLGCKTIAKKRYYYYSACYLFEDHAYRNLIMEFQPDSFFIIRNSNGIALQKTRVGKWEMISPQEVIIRIDGITDTTAFDYYRPYEDIDVYKILDGEKGHFPRIFNDTVFFSENFNKARLHEFDFVFCKKCKWGCYKFDRFLKEVKKRNKN